ncbi:MAG: c-type cytochrome [Aquabacterium sp.]|uniref:c-type cytochrome n=1 Tax=Aquabacterium sp. TaxID=1872578 RepID=UPI001225F703|nr:c-type cytochrome [Aquabacterium sp.]TAK95290.1 MAG: c-type cytochrome [Aquabacterium sp.]
MKKNIQHTLLAMLIGVIGASQAEHANAAGDPKKGADVFAGECGDCHSPKEGKAKKGPPLFGVNGRKAASIAEFAYSDAMKQSGITWTPDKIDLYITKPKKLVPGGKMKYDGLDDAAQRADVIAYLQSLK